MGVTAIANIFFLLIFKVLQLITDAILAIIYRGPTVPTVPIREDCLLESATGIAARIRNKQITSEEVVEACIRRIKDVNGTLNAVVENRFEEALAEAREVDKLIAKGSKTTQELEKEKPFLGVPFTTKDGVGIQGVVQAAGVVARKGTRAKEDAEAIALLRAAGGIPIATTNIPELSSWWETRNALYGTTANPYHTQRTCGGSSGGEAAILAAAGSFMGIGTDVGGSVRIPANFCGIFAHKPSMDVVPDKGRVPAPDQADSINVVGPMCKKAVDLKQMMRILDKSKKLKLDTKVDIKKLRYFYLDDNPEAGWLSFTDGTDSNVKKAMKAVVNYLEQSEGVKVERAVELSGHMKEANAMWWVKMNDKPDAGLMASSSTLAGICVELVKAAIGLSAHALITPPIWFRQWLSPKYATQSHTTLLNNGKQLTKLFQDLLGKDGVLLYPSSATAAVRHNATIFHMESISYTAIFNLVKVPVTQCPIMQTEEGLPVGVQVVAAQHNDHLTLAVAETLETAFGGWKPPPSQPKW